MKNQPKKNTAPPLWVLILITVAGGLAMHIFVPALPNVAATFNTSTTEVQLTVTLYILGLSMGQLIYGPISDYRGRKPLLIIGLVIYCLATAMTVFTNSIDTLITARFFQAIGACSGLAIARAIVRDTSSASSAIKSLALLNLIMMISPGLSPALGGMLTVMYGWRSVCIVLLMVGASALFATLRYLPETLHTKSKVHIRSILSDYVWLIKSPTFMSYSIAGACATSAVYAFISSAPFLYTQDLGRPLTEVGIYLGILIIGMALGNVLARVLSSRMTIHRIMLIGCSITLTAAVFLAGVNLASQISVLTVTSAVFFIAFGGGTTSPGAITSALSVNTRINGSAAGLYGFSQMLVGALSTYLLRFFESHVNAIASILLGAALIGLCCLQLSSTLTDTD